MGKLKLEYTAVVTVRNKTYEIISMTLQIILPILLLYKIADYPQYWTYITKITYSMLLIAILLFHMYIELVILKQKLKHNLELDSTSLNVICTELSVIECRSFVNTTVNVPCKSIKYAVKKSNNTIIMRCVPIVFTTVKLPNGVTERIYYNKDLEAELSLKVPKNSINEIYNILKNNIK